MPYSKNTFISPMSDQDTTVKIVDIRGATRYMLMEPDASLSLEQRKIRVTQRADSAALLFDFATQDEARAAMILLQQALARLRRNKSLVPTTTDDGMCEHPQRNVMLSDIWGESDKIPVPHPDMALWDVVGVIEYVEIELAHVTGTLGTFGDEELKDAVTPWRFGPSYEYLLTTQAGETIPMDWNGLDVDEECGVIRFDSLQPQGGLVVSPSQPPLIRFFKYVGLKGVRQGGAPLTYHILPSDLGQTTWNLGFTPAGVAGVYVNGQLIDNLAGGDYAVTGELFVWTNPQFVLEPGDVVMVQYYV